MILEVPLIVDGKKKLFKTKSLTNTKVYVELANLISKIEYDTATLELLTLVKTNDLDLIKLQSGDDEYINSLDKNVLLSIIETQTKPKDLKYIAINNDIYKQIISLVVNIEITDAIWDDQDYKEVDAIILQFRNFYK